MCCYIKYGPTAIISQIVVAAKNIVIVISFLKKARTIM
jgi:hypothetical protein